MQPRGGLNRPPRGGARRIGCRQRHVQKAASGGFYASRTPRCCLGIIEAPFLTRTVAVGARTGPPPRTAGASEQPLWRAHEAATGACWRQERAAARAAVWLACVERAVPRPMAARWPRGRPAARSAERRFSVPARGARLRPLGRRGGAARRLQAGRGWPGGGGWSCQGRAEQRGRAPGPAAVAAARGLACMRMFCSWRYNRGCISGSGDE